MKLLDRAKIVLTRKICKNRLHKEDYELIEAWLKGKISLMQVRSVLDKYHGAGIYSYLALGARDIFMKKEIK